MAAAIFMTQGVNAMGFTAIDLGMRGAVSGVFLQPLRSFPSRHGGGSWSTLVGVMLNGRRAPRETAAAAAISGPAVR